MFCCCCCSVVWIYVPLPLQYRNVVKKRKKEKQNEESVTQPTDACVIRLGKAVGNLAVVLSAEHQNAKHIHESLI